MFGKKSLGSPFRSGHGVVVSYMFTSSYDRRQAIAPLPFFHLCSSLPNNIHLSGSDVHLSRRLSRERTGKALRKGDRGQEITRASVRACKRARGSVILPLPCTTVPPHTRRPQKTDGKRPKSCQRDSAAASRSLRARTSAPRSDVRCAPGPQLHTKSTNLRGTSLEDRRRCGGDVHASKREGGNAPPEAIVGLMLLVFHIPITRLLGLIFN